MKRFLTGLTLLLLLAAAPSMAQDYEEEERDLLEVSLFGGTAIPSGGFADWGEVYKPKNGLMLGIDFGYFLSPNMVLGVNVNYIQYKVDNENVSSDLKHRLFNPSLYLKYYFFGDSDFVPYLKGHVGVDNPRFVTRVEDPEPRFRELSYSPGFGFGAGVGAFYYTSDYSGLFLEVGVHQSMTEESDKEYGGTTWKFGENVMTLDIKAGINVYFGSGE